MSLKCRENMKELSIKEKAQRYDEAKARMSRAYDSNRCTIGFMNEIFPELEENQDERIRREMVSYFKQINYDNAHTWNGINLNKFVAWLEKQGEQKSQGKSALEAAKEEKVDNQNCVKPVDKVEPIIVRDFNSVFSREQVEEIDKRIEESQRLYNAKLRDAMRKVEDFPMTH